MFSYMTLYHNGTKEVIKSDKLRLRYILRIRVDLFLVHWSEPLALFDADLEYTLSIVVV